MSSSTLGCLMKRKRDWLNAVTLQTLGNGGNALQRFFGN
jgi:hypothetical protein